MNWLLNKKYRIKDKFNYFNITIMIVGVLLICLLVALQYFKSKDIYSNIDKISYNSILEQAEKEYLVYYYRKDCVYCTSIEEKILELDKITQLYLVNMNDIANKTAYYDYEVFHAINDIEIGKLGSDGKIDYYDGESEEKYINKSIYDKEGNEIDYEIVIAEGTYLELNPNAKMGYVYAKNNSLPIKIDVDNAKQFRIGGTPAIIKVFDGKIVHYWEGEECNELFGKVLIND